MNNIPTKRKLDSKEIFEQEKVMHSYDGSDKVVSSHELVEALKKEGDVNVYTAQTGFPSLDRMLKGVEEGEVVVVTGPSGDGKCFGKGTPVIMFDGSIKKIEDIKVGEKVMGWDSTPRLVKALGRGIDEMYRVDQTKGDSYVVNKEHILTLRVGSKPKRSKSMYQGRVIDIPLLKYVNQSKTFKNVTKGFKMPIEFPKKEISVDPYFLGLWLGDGHSDGTRITTADSEIVDFLKSFAFVEGMKLRMMVQKNNKSSVYSLSKGWRNHVLEKMKEMGVINNKHIPVDYKINDRDVRLRLLAGIIDSDGYTNHGGYMFVSKNKEMAEDVCFIARSLGFQSYVKPITKRIKKIGFSGLYYSVGISGDCSIIPVLIKRKKVNQRKQIKDILNTGIKITHIGRGDYYGFELDGDGRFLLGDFTVTHNTTLLMSITRNMAEYGEKCLWFTLEVTPRQFMNKIRIDEDKLPLFYIPAAAMDLADEDYVKEWERKHNRSYETMDWIEDKIVEAKVKHDEEGKPVRVVFIDHIHQLFSINQQSKNLSLEVGDLVARIKHWALSKGLIVFLIAHCRDIPTEQSQREPRMGDIRDSGMISRIADIVLGVWRIRNQDDVTIKKRVEVGEHDTKAKVAIFKNRREGIKSSFAVYHAKHYLSEDAFNGGDDENF